MARRPPPPAEQAGLLASFRRPPERHETSAVDSGGKSSAERTFEGQLLGLRQGAVAGWVWHPDRPYEPLDVELYIGDICVARGRADQFDIELAKASRGNGMHRFEIRLNRIPSESPPFQIRAVVSGTKWELRPALSVTTLDEVESLLSGSEYVGQITGVADGMIQGWALNKSNPHENPVLTMRDGSRTIAVQQAVEQSSATIDAGVVAPVFRFQFPLPATALDGQLHAFSVTAGEAAIAISGSPVLFGPVDSVSIAKTLVAVAERLEKLESQLESQRAVADISHAEKRLAATIMEPLDMLLGVHRDSVERELSVMRRQLTEIARRTPDFDTEVIEALRSVPAVEDVPIPDESSFGTVERSAPLMKYDLAVHTPLAQPSGGLKWLGGAGGVSIGGSGFVALEGLAAEDASVILRGTGAYDPAEFGALLLTFNGRPMSGRFDLGAEGDWSFTGNMLDASGDKSPVRGLGIEYLVDIHRPTGRLALTEMIIFGPGRAPARADARPPTSSIINLGKEVAARGWHPVEMGGRGGICWMGESGEIALNLQSASTYTIDIPEIRPLTADIMTKLEMFLDDTPVAMEIEPRRGDSATFRVRGRCSSENGGRHQQNLRIRFPRECVRSPMELGLNQDTRPLTVALRCVILSASEA